MQQAAQGRAMQYSAVQPMPIRSSCVGVHVLPFLLPSFPPWPAIQPPSAPDAMHKRRESVFWLFFFLFFFQFVSFLLPLRPHWPSSSHCKHHSRLTLRNYQQTDSIEERRCHPHRPTHTRLTPIRAEQRRAHRVARIRSVRSDPIGLDIGCARSDGHHHRRCIPCSCSCSCSHRAIDGE